MIICCPIVFKNKAKMEDLSSQRDKDVMLIAPSNSVEVDIPICEIDPKQENFGIDSTSVEEARVYLSKLRIANAPLNEQKQGEIYLKKLER
ncbi:uncharacterized protein PRCAT00004757001 [Priceomyces carsonii]|uniref:uncharacterized protein n=1 Tax=Priceomyces carsonii TaxID=28549 RepID=UPI002ED9AE0D|nr:unnamed protein product [Priceomyces carsonii]